MEKRIRTLYIITIVAILAFLGMQVYWLYGRYEFALTEYERALGSTVIECVEKYAAIRDKSPEDYRRSKVSKSPNDSIINIPTFEIQQRGQYGDSVQITRKSTIKTYLFSAHELLGLEPGAVLTEEQKYKVAELAEQQMTNPADSAVFDASGAKDDTEAWIATKNVSIERKAPFTVEGMDTVLQNAGISARISISKADSPIWETKVTSNNFTLVPELTLTIPYSQLEGRIATIVCPVNPFEILPDMWQTLVITLLISLLLIVCLVLQFSTVLKLNRLDRMRNGFITTMIHELKRPISTLKMCVSGIENEAMMAQPDVKREIVGETRGALDILSAYFSKLRDITFNEVEQIPLNLTEINLRELFDDVCAAVTVPADRSVDFANDIAAGITVSADRTHLFNILSNLVENSVKYAGDTIEVRASALIDDRYVTVTVGDNGCGISRDDLPHIFKRFYRGRASAAGQPGMGLGLAYVRLLVGAHGGDITAESRENEGTNFIIRLPR